MKKFFYTLLIFIIIFFPIKNTLSYYHPADSKKISIQTKKTSLLLKKHTTTLEKQLIYFEKKLDLKNDKKIKSWLGDINKINIGLNAIKNDKIDKLKASILIKTIIKKLKTINSELKPYLKKRIIKNKLEVKNTKNKYKKAINNFIKNLKNAINKIGKNLSTKNNINSKDKAIIYHLRKIKNSIILLGAYEKKEFYNTKELKLYLIKNIKDILNEINEIKIIIKRA